MSQPRTRVAVVFGGTSSEHGVSCLTAAGVVAALDPDRYDVVGIGITRTGRWISVDPVRIAALGVVGEHLPELGEDADDAILLRGANGSELAIRDPFNADGLVTHDSAPDPAESDQLPRPGSSPGSATLSRLGPVEVAIALLHGPFGEDGTIQGLFEMMGIRYVGAGVLASAVGMDKHFMKLVLSASGLPVGPFVTITPAEWARDRDAALNAVSKLTFPVFVKPARAGSSMGISKVDEPAGLEAAIDFAHEHDPKVIVEEGFVGAREVECGVLADPTGGPPQASELAEISLATKSGFYDFEAKYLPEEQVRLDVPADLEPELASEIKRLAVATFDAVECEGLARVDVFVTADGQVVINEINTMPGFTPHSMFPRMWAATGLPYSELLDRLITLAIQRPVGLR